MADDRDAPGPRRRNVAAPELEPLELRLAPLSPEAAATLVVAATEGSPLSPQRTDELARRAGGNPLFLLELLAGGAGGGSGDAMPESIEAVLTSQIDRLAAPDRLVLRYAAVLGMRVDEQLLPSLMRDEAPAPTPDTWQRLAGLVERSREGTLRFRQELTRDAAYEGLPFRTRRELHARAASAIAEAGGWRADEEADLLSLHALHAHRFEDAWRYACIAGDRAAAVYANVDAVRLYERALAAARELPDVPTAELAAVHEAIGDVRALLGEFVPAGTAYARARRVSRHDRVAQGRLLLKHARIPERLGRYAEALRWNTRGLRVLTGRDDPEAARQRAQLTVWRAAVLQAQGRHGEAIRWCEQAIVEAEASADRDALAHAYFLLDWAHFDLGRPERATFSRVALGIYEELGDLGRQAVVLNNLGAWAYYRGDWDEAVELYERGRETRERTGDAVNAAFGTCNVGEILSDQGRLDEAEPRFREAKRVWQAAGDRPGVAFVTSALGRVATRAGRPDEALALLEEARAGFAHVGARVDVIDTVARIAECHALHGRPEEALELADESQRRGRALAELHAQLPLLERVRGWALVQLGERDAALEAFGASVDGARRRQAEYEFAVTLDAMARTPALLDHDEADACRAEADRIPHPARRRRTPGGPGGRRRQVRARGPAARLSPSRARSAGRSRTGSASRSPGRRRPCDTADRRTAARCDRSRGSRGRVVGRRRSRRRPGGR